jgi:short-subunit dehydrogenase
MFRFSLLWGLLSGLGYFFWRFFSPQHSDLILENKVVIVTGASSGIGRALAIAFARRGARIVLTARRQDLLEEVQKEIAPYAAATHIIQADLTDDKQLRRIVPETLETFGQIDVLVNNAGRNGGKLFQNTTPDRIDAHLALNLRAPMMLTHQVLALMIAQGSGSIINIGSTTSRVAAPTFVSYGTSKYGLAGFTDALRREIQGTGVHVMLALPGWVRTEMVPPTLVKKVVQRGFEVLDADEVAEKFVQGLLRGREEMLVGDRLLSAAIIAERYAPILHRLYWRIYLTRNWIGATKKIP